MQTIRVHQFGEPEVLSLETVNDLVPEADQILVSVRAVGINPVETYIRSGKYKNLPPLPYTPGSDGAGIIEAVGNRVQNWKVGDRVIISGSLTGTYAEKVLCLSSHLYKLPSSASFEQGAAIGVPFGTAYRALLQKAKPAAGSWVLIHGATGAVGIASLQLAKAAGLKVIATAGSEKGEALLRNEKADFVLNHHDSKIVWRVLEITGGKGVSIILEMLADQNLAKDLEMVAKEGKIMVIGCRGNVTISPREAMVREASLHGVLFFNTPEAERNALYLDIVKLWESKKINPVIGSSFPLEQAAEAHRKVMESGAAGKVVLVCR